MTSLLQKNNYGTRSWLIVDGYSSGALYAKLLKERGDKVYHVQSHDDALSPRLVTSFVPDDYDGNFIFSGTIQDLISELTTIPDLQYILPGCETGIELADTLSETLGLPSNGSRMSAARRDKFLMAEAVSAQNLRAAKSIKVSDGYQLVQAAYALGYPLVVKPLTSAASEDVYICHTESAAQEALTCILGKYNAMGIFNDTALVQTLLRGNQYVVNTASYEGKHYVVEIWKDHRIDTGSSYIYDREELQIEDTGNPNIINYCSKVLDALDIKYGPAHIELMVDGLIPTLIEVGARPAGGIQHKVMLEAQGFSHVSAAINVLCQESGWRDKPQKAKKYVLAVALVSKAEGIVGGYKTLEVVRDFESFESLTGLPPIGATLEITRDIASQPGLLMLVHVDSKQIAKDYTAFRSLEASGLFII
jgi:biotin carboxylase